MSYQLSGTSVRSIAPEKAPMDPRTHPPTEPSASSSLDVLVPPPMSIRRRLTVGAIVVAVATAIAVGHLGGWFVPRPVDGASFGSDSALRVDRERGLVAAHVLLPNVSRRTVRVTDVSLDAPGVRLVAVEATRPTDRTLARADGDGGVSTGLGTDTAPSRPLPVRIPPGEQVDLILWLRPETCGRVSAPWGVASATVDFGEGAVPPVSRTVVLREDPIWSGGMVRASTGSERDELAGSPLSLVCEVLR